MNTLNTSMISNQNLILEDEIDVKELWRIIKSFRKSILLISMIIIGITAYVH